MAIFKKGRRVELPADPDAHQHTLGERQGAASARVTELRGLVEEIGEDHAAALLEARFDDAEELAGRLEAGKADLTRAETHHAALEAAARELGRERLRIDMAARLAELERLQAEAADRASAALAELPVAVREVQDLARDALAHEQAMENAAHQAHTIRHQLAQFDDATVSVPRFSVSRPVSAAFERHPEYRALSNRNWFLGVPGPVQG
jgi:hypothetical protein